MYDLERAIKDKFNRDVHIETDGDWVFEITAEIAEMCTPVTEGDCMGFVYFNEVLWDYLAEDFDLNNGLQSAARSVVYYYLRDSLDQEAESIANKYFKK